MAPGACLLLPRVNFIARHLAPLHRAFLHRSCLGSSPTLTPSFFRVLQAAAAVVSSGMYAPPMRLLFVRGCLLASLSLPLSLRVWLIEPGKRNLGRGAALESANCSEFRFGLERGTNKGVEDCGLVSIQCRLWSNKRVAIWFVFALQGGRRGSFTHEAMGLTEVLPGSTRIGYFIFLTLSFCGFRKSRKIWALLDSSKCFCRHLLVSVHFLHFQKFL